MDDLNNPSGLDYLHEVTGDAATFINLFQGRQPQTLAQPAVSVGVTGQSGLLIVLAVVVVGAIWVATKK
jgi:hypothetical protein